MSILEFIIGTEVAVFILSDRKTREEINKL